MNSTTPIQFGTMYPASDNPNYIVRHSTYVEGIYSVISSSRYMCAACLTDAGITFTKHSVHFSESNWRFHRDIHHLSIPFSALFTQHHLQEPAWGARGNNCKWCCEFCLAWINKSQNNMSYLHAQNVICKFAVSQTEFNSQVASR
jgi:hypothetical protein